MALRIGLGIALLTLLACGSGEPAATAGTDAGAAAAGAAAGGAPDMAATPDVSTAPPADAGTAPEVQRCLDLVAQAEFPRALPVCLAAARVDPNNPQVQAAIDRARTETAAASAAAGAATDAAAGAAGAAADSAAGAAADSAAGAMGAATEKLPGAP